MTGLGGIVVGWTHAPCLFCYTVWHQRTTVLDRVANYLQQRIPEIIDVNVEDPYQLTDEANEVW